MTQLDDYRDAYQQTESRLVTLQGVIYGLHQLALSHDGLSNNDENSQAIMSLIGAAGEMLDTAHKLHEAELSAACREAAA